MPPNLVREWRFHRPPIPAGNALAAEITGQRVGAGSVQKRAAVRAAENSLSGPVLEGTNQFDEHLRHATPFFGVLATTIFDDDGFVGVARR
jgi:hypothetical protein